MGAAGEVPDVEGEHRARRYGPGALQEEEPRRALLHLGGDGLRRLAEEVEEVLLFDPVLRETAPEVTIPREGALCLPAGKAARRAGGILRRLRIPAGDPPQSSPLP